MAVVVKLNYVEVILWLCGIDYIAMMLGAVVAIAVMTERMMRMAFGLMLMIVAVVVVLIGEMNVGD